MAVVDCVEKRDLECGICLELLCEPIQLGCSHAFCRRCSSLAFRRQRCCPLCRAAIPSDFDPENVTVNPSLEQILVRACTVEYAARLEDVAAAAARLVRLRIGNQFDFLGMRNMRATFQWTLGVELEASDEAEALATNAALPDLVACVRFGLPAACRVRAVGSKPVSAEVQEQPAAGFVEVNASPFEVTATSWTAFTVPIVIMWKEWLRQPPLRLEHALDFNRDGGSWSYGVELSEMFPASVPPEPVEDPQPVILPEQRTTPGQGPEVVRGTGCNPFFRLPRFRPRFRTRKPMLV